MVEAVHLDRVSKRSCGLGWFSEVSTIPSKDQVLHDVPVPQVLEQLVDVSKSVLQDGVQRWNAEQSSEFPPLPELRRVSSNGL